MTWLVKLDGHDFDLLPLYEQLPGPDYSVLKMTDNEYYLGAQEFRSDMDAKSVHEAAANIIAVVNGIANACNESRRSISFGGFVIRVLDDGTREIFAFPRPLTIRSSATISIPSDVSSRGVSVLEVTLKKAISDKLLGQALRQFGRDKTWHNLYKAFEAINRSKGSKKEQMIKNGWATNTELTRFTQTANSWAAAGDDARHAGDSDSPPENPMSIEEARALIRKLIRLKFNLDQ